MDLILFFIQVGIMLSFALFFGQIMRQLNQPAILGELIGGILLGPTVFGLFAPDAYLILFPAQGETALGREAVINIGMLFFLFVAGLEVDLAQLRRSGLSVALTGFLGVLIPFGLGFAMVLLLPDLWGTRVQNQLFIFALFMGTALSISALPIIARILVDLNLMKKETGVVVMAAATINDLIGWTLFALILSALTPGGLSGEKPWITLILALGISVAIVCIGRLIGPGALRWLRAHLSWPSGFIAATSIMILASAVTVEAIGIHATFGAFLLGVALGRSHAERNEAQDIIYQFAVSFFAPLYFVSIGIKVNFIDHFDLLVTLIILLTACVGKIFGAGLGALLGGMKIKEALVVGFGMNARGAMEIILASVALKHNLIDQRIFVALIIMALITSLLSAPVMQRLMKGENS